MKIKNTERKCKDCEVIISYIPRKVRCNDCHQNYLNNAMITTKKRENFIKSTKLENDKRLKDAIYNILDKDDRNINEIFKILKI